MPVLLNILVAYTDKYIMREKQKSSLSFWCINFNDHKIPENKVIDSLIIGISISLQIDIQQQTNIVNFPNYHYIMKISNSNNIKIYLILLSTICAAFAFSTQALYQNQDVGYRVGKVKSYKKLKQFKGSALYELQCDQLDDSRPIKLLDLHGTHFQAGYAYAKLMAPQISFSYKTFFHSALDTQLQIKVIQLFLDWQYDSFVRKQLPMQFIDEIKGIRKGGSEQGYPLLSTYFERVLVVSSFPGAIENDIASILADQFIRSVLRIKNQKIQSFIQDSYLKVVEIIKKFIKKTSIHCSFFAVWGSRTKDSKLYSMRNLDWLENTGVNQNKLITVWNVQGTIPHLTLGFPGVLGALTGMSKAGLTVHEAGLSSHRSTELGFQWTLRMRYIMMNAKNLQQAKKIWQSTNNTLGMNFMITSANDNTPTGHPALAMETMRAYTAYFYDNDQRQNSTKFIDPKTKKQYVAGYSMKDALFRTNHAYDPIIRKHMRSKQIQENDDSMIRYRTLKDIFNWYKNNDVLMGPQEAVNMTAILGDKGSEKFLTCKNNFRGINVISVTYYPKELIMWAAFEYGFNQTFRSACCGVYVEIDTKKWFGQN